MFSRYSALISDISLTENKTERCATLSAAISSAAWPLGGFALTPLALALSACGKSGWPEGMVEIKWDRDTCVRCSMVISDRRFAAQMRGGPKNMVFKFDDIGCVIFWLKDNLKTYPWWTNPPPASGSPM